MIWIPNEDTSRREFLKLTTTSISESTGSVPHIAGLNFQPLIDFIAAEPDRAFFGQKDAAQVAVLRRMVADLRLATEIVVCPIVREADGLALSSRNIYLSSAERAQALMLSRAVREVEAMVTAGESRARVLIDAARQAFAAVPAIRVDYVELVDWATLEPVEMAVPGSLFAVAAWVGATRLIDNTILG